MAKAKQIIDESGLTKMQLRKLNMLRKSMISSSKLRPDQTQTISTAARFISSVHSM